jgi:(S)-2-hydroxyglutarate dehydrogenase
MHGPDRVPFSSGEAVPTSDQHCDVAIIGAGIVGLAVGLHLVRRLPGTTVLILDKESEVASHQTGHNSGVIHSGLYYKPGSLKARLCVEGAAAMVHFCQDYGLPHEVCGKLVVATEEREIPQLNELLRRGRANGLSGLRELDASAIREIEPHAAGVRGLLVPSTGITDFRLVAQKYAELLCQAGGEILTGRKVESIRHDQNSVNLETAGGMVRARFAINCAGLQSDLVARMAGARFGLRIIPFRGEYYKVAAAKEHLVRTLIYPVADPRFPFLGVHFTRRIAGGLDAGPNAVFAFKREGYLRTAFDFRDMASAALFPGFWKMAAHYWSSGLAEQYRSWSKRAFTTAARKLVPSLSEDDLEPGGSGVRAQALDGSGRLLDDFYFVYQKRILHVCNVPSPAATSSLVIGREIVKKLLENADLQKVQGRPGNSPTAAGQP